MLMKKSVLFLNYDHTFADSFFVTNVNFFIQHDNVPDDKQIFLFLHYMLFLLRVHNLLDKEVIDFGNVLIFSVQIVLIWVSCIFV